MSNLFAPKSKEEFLESVDRGIAQLDAGLGQDAFEALDEITSELEAGYQAMKAAKTAHTKKVATPA